MSKRQFKSQASSSRVDSGAGFGGFGAVFAGSTLSYLSEPPNLSTVTDANVVVAFKNLLKKDDTTKAKGLEDLRLFVQSHPHEQDGGVEQPILEAWVKIYPRISIDNSRRVRELSHNLQYELLKSARKRMEKYIPTIVGAWLAGTYDRDRPVARAADDGITSFLDTEDKVIAFWRRCQSQILEYAQEAIKESPETLSDERNTNPDEMQAKFIRVYVGSMSLVINLLLKLHPIDIQRHEDAYENFLSGNKTLWNFSASDDASLRRTSAQLLSICLDKQSAIIERDLELLSHAFVAEGLRASQRSSALQFLTAFNRLTQRFPEVWTTAYKGKKPALTRLRQFIERGSQGGPPEYWQNLTSLILQIPSGVLPSDLDGAMDLLKAQRDGMSSREEARANAPAAWNSYFEVTKHLVANLSDEKNAEQLLSNAVFPVFEQFLLPILGQTSWSVGNSNVALAKAFQICWLSEKNGSTQPLGDEWKRLVEKLATSMLASLPEQSKDYDKSQAAVIAMAHRWFGLQSEILRSAKSAEYQIPLESVLGFLSEPCSALLIKCLEVLVNRNGKPYGAAGTLETAVRMIPEVITVAPVTQRAIESFLQTEFPKLILSPSSEYLIATVYSFRPLLEQNNLFEVIWQAAMDGLLATPAGDRKRSAAQGLISNQSASPLAQEDTELQSYLFEYTSQLMNELPKDWSLFDRAVTYKSFSPTTSKRLMSIFMNSLRGDDDETTHALRAMEFIAQENPQALIGDDGTHLALLSRLLALTELHDVSVASRANALKKKIEMSQNISSDPDQIPSSTLEILRENFENVDHRSLAIDTLVGQAESFIDATGGFMTAQVLPNIERWFNVLRPLLESKPNPTLSFISAVGPAVSLVQVSGRTSPYPYRDINGYSSGFRMALYTSKLLNKRDYLTEISQDDQVETLWLLTLTQLLANDQLGLEEGNKLWMDLRIPDVESQIQDFLSSSEIVLMGVLKDATTWRIGATEGQSAVAEKLVAKWIRASREYSLLAFYAARALSKILATLVEAHGWKSVGGDEWLSSHDLMKTSVSSVFPSVAVLSGLQEVLQSSKLVNNFCNRLISDIAGAKPQQEKTLSILILLNATLAVYEQGSLPVAQNRLVFGVKQITSWMTEDQSLPMPLAAEACRSLQFLLPSITEVYGPYWQTALDFCIGLWMNSHIGGNLNEKLPALHASLRLVNILKALPEANEDLLEALSDSSVKISQGLLDLLRLPRTERNQPWSIFDELVSRRAMEIPIQDIKDLSTIYPLVASECRFVQLAAFQILNRALPAAQEQISVDVLLEKTDARLPEELLSLLLDAPVYQNLEDEILAQFPPQLRTYLFSWELVFASYPKASYKVRNDYSEMLKSENYISQLLAFLFDVLGHSAARPINLDKTGFTLERIQSYDLILAESETDERNMQWLLVNLYYLCLKYAPNLAKNWWMNCKSKQTRIAVESWTGKYFSPLVIADTLDEVAKWAEQQEAPTDDEKELIIKVSKKSREVYAGFEVDDMQMQIVIRLPVTYPLESVKVDGINRVAVSEKKWQSWLMITQGVITFSNGSIIDGLTTFKKNVMGALRGQTECAICYSIISSDKKMPDKRCQTCKNLFHSSCLFKWFASSNQSTCPLCRNPFNYGTDVASRARRRGGPE